MKYKLAVGVGLEIEQAAENCENRVRKLIEEGFAPNGQPFALSTQWPTRTNQVAIIQCLTMPEDNDRG